MQPCRRGKDDRPSERPVWWDDRGVHRTTSSVVADPIGGSQGWYDTGAKVTRPGRTTSTATSRPPGIT
ncbi:MAG: hypothetical protein M5R42_06555 [Rhodocyclaceae bacterium]|nr:hypothetical protein [Rhodocyclaceae bacterium]